VKSYFVRVNITAGDTGEGTVVQLLRTVATCRELGVCNADPRPDSRNAGEQTTEIRTRLIRAGRVVASHCLDS
jgi:hypothetical protein